MRHNYKGRKLGTDYSHTKAMKRSLVSALFLNDRIKTIESRAKEIRGDVDKIITWAKRGDLHSRRLAIAALGNDSALVREIFEKVEQGMFADRNGGYTRITKLGNRKGDNARMVIMELITESVPKKKKKAEPKKAQPKKAAPEKVEEKTAEEEKVEAVEEATEATSVEEAQETVDTSEDVTSEDKDTSEAASDDAEAEAEADEQSDDESSADDEEKKEE